MNRSEGDPLSVGDAFQSQAPRAIQAELAAMQMGEKNVFGLYKGKTYLISLVDKAISWPIDWRHSIDLQGRLVWLSACRFSGRSTWVGSGGSKHADFAYKGKSVCGAVLAG
ncbi:hypothetical protein ACEP28_32850 [Pseudomonas aeruginosa]|uniref:hypothetical protein n=1 Tax=Pseudomonas aeruginosa TaxID=287 RepID=UPI00104BBA33|nr:hypothetical protein [Pseudomonas aeruginosa]